MRIYFLFILFLSIGATTSQATHAAGSDITMKYVSDSVYDFYFTYYRDCRGVPFSNPSSRTKIKCLSSGATTTLTLTRISITGISVICSTATKPCNPTNTRSGDGTEEHVYKARIDFRTSAYKSYYTCGNVIIETSICCRNSALTTGAGNTNFYNYLQIDLGKAPKNSSPTFDEAPNMRACCNIPNTFNFEARDADGDSLSYHLSDPLTAWNKKASYVSGYSAEYPVKCYGTGKANPYTIPPNGFYLDPTFGRVVFVPTNCADYSIMILTVKEWRKNSKGTYEQIGMVNRELQIQVGQCSSNNPPEIKGTYRYTVCEGDSITFTITSDDKVKKPPPPTPSPNADTSKLSWNKGIPEASFRIVSDTALNQSAVFSWRPKKGASSKKVYEFIVFAGDNHCPKPARVSRKYSIIVKPNVYPEIEMKRLSCGKYAIEVKFDTTVSASVEWFVYDTASVLATPVFQSTNTSIGNRRLDTLTMDTSGVFKLLVRTKLGNCTSEDVYDFTTSGTLNLLNLKDTTVCSDIPFDIAIDTSLLNAGTRLQWMYKASSDTNTTFSGQLSGGNEILYLKITGLDGCVQDDSIFIHTSYKPGLVNMSDTVHCQAGYPIFTAIDLLDSGKVNNLVLWSTGSKKDTIHGVRNGEIWVEMSNSCGADRDSFNLLFDSIYQPYLGGDYRVCDDDSLLVGDLIARDHVRYKWSTGDTTSFIVLRKIGGYSLEVTNGCGIRVDSMRVHFDHTPESLTWQDTIVYCDTIDDIYDAANPGFTYLWDDASRLRTKQIRTSGWHSVVVRSINCGEVEDSTYAKLLVSPVIKLQNDTSLKKPFTLTLDAGSHLGRYEWSTGVSTQRIVVSDYGTYWVELSNVCDTVRDSIVISLKVGISEFKTFPFDILPNPSFGSFEVHSSGRSIDDIKLYDNLGREVRIRVENQSSTSVVSLTNHQPGMYIVLIQSGDQVSRKKLLIR